jgi:tripartite-type tricarboxylate transporter receptor subunit TctC
LLIFAHPTFPASNIKATIALAKEKPGTISYATPGSGSIHHLSMELLAYLTGTRFVHVPYRGGAPALNDVLGGHVPLSVLSVFQALPHSIESHQAARRDLSEGDRRTARRCLAR